MILTQFILFYESHGARLFALQAYGKINEMFKVNFNTTTENEIHSMNTINVYFF